MMHMFIKFATSVLALMAITNWMPGIEVQNWSTAIVAVLVMGIINALLKPILVLMTLPINLLTLGLFTFILNAILFGLSAYLVPGFEVNGFFNCLFGSILYGLISTLLLWVLESLLSPRNAS